MQVLFVDGLFLQDAQFLATLVHTSPSSGPKMSRHDVTKGIDAPPKLLTANPGRRRLRPFGPHCFFYPVQKMWKAQQSIRFNRKPGVYAGGCKHVAKHVFW